MEQSAKTKPSEAKVVITLLVAIIFCMAATAGVEYFGSVNEMESRLFLPPWSAVVGAGIAALLITAFDSIGEKGSILINFLCASGACCVYAGVFLVKYAILSRGLYTLMLSGRFFIPSVSFSVALLFLGLLISVSGFLLYNWSLTKLHEMLQPHQR